MKARFKEEGICTPWPAKPSEQIQIIEDSYIRPDMVAKAVTGTPIDQAIQWGEEHVRKVVEGRAG
jgi:hypothetical protein